MNLTIKTTYMKHEGGTKDYFIMSVTNEHSESMLFKRYGKVNSHGKIITTKHYGSDIVNYEHRKIKDQKSRRGYNSHYLHKGGNSSIDLDEFFKPGIKNLYHEWARGLTPTSVFDEIVEKIQEYYRKYFQVEYLEPYVEEESKPEKKRPEPVRSAEWGTW